MNEFLITNFYFAATRKESSVVIGKLKEPALLQRIVLIFVIFVRDY